MQSILDYIRAEIATIETHLRKLKTAESALSEDGIVGTATSGPTPLARLISDEHLKVASGSITEAIQAQLDGSGPMTKGDLETALSDGRQLGKQTVSATLQAMKKRGIVTIKNRKWKLV